MAYFTDALDPRVLCAAHGWWFPEGSPETQYDWQTSNFNMLTSVGKLGKEYGTPNLKGTSLQGQQGMNEGYPGIGNRV